MSECKIIPLLKKITLFSSFADEELLRITNRIHIDSFKKNELAIQEGDFSNSMYIVLSGKVTIAITNEDGRNVTVAIRQAGDFFGELSLIDSKDTCASVRTLESSTIGRISKESFWSLMRSNEKFLSSIFSDLLIVIKK